jgi:hypothetical protein
MTAVSYREYADDLHRRIARLRASSDVLAAIDIAICRNSYCYKSTEFLGPSSSRHYTAGPLASTSGMSSEDGSVNHREVEAFFAMPVIYAYSDLALKDERNPLAKAHWDGTVALIEVRYETPVAKWHQRMLFIGFDDPIHADFATGLDADLFVTGENKGTQLFEWRAETPGAEEVLSPAITTLSQPAAHPSLGKRIAGFAAVRWDSRMRLRTSRSLL